MKTLTFSTEGKYSESVSALAISYLRWSSAIQGTGDTLRRQTDKIDAWLAARPHVRLAQELIDAGVSAFRGKNIKDGAFGALLTAVQDGKIPRGTYLLVESLDRISRLTPEEALAIFLQLINAGIIIVTLMDGQEYRSGQNDILMLLFKSIMIMATAHEEVLKRSERIKESWVGRTKAARESGKAIKGNLPAWLYYDARGILKSDEAKVAIVQRIFDMCISGAGLQAIAATLNREGLVPLSLHKRKAIKNRSDNWTVTTVACILRYRAVYGDYHPNKAEPIYGIFPVIVSKEDFHRAEAARAKRLTVVRGRSGKHYTNLFKGIAKCHYCGGAMTIKNGRNKRSPNRPLQIQCEGLGVQTCNHKPWNYPMFESAFLSVVREIDTRAIIDGGKESRTDKLTKKLQSLQGERLAVQKAQDAFIEMIKKNPVLAPSFATAMVDNQTKLAAINEQMKTLGMERNKAQAERIASNELLPVELPQDAIVRAKVAEHIRTIVELVTLRRDSSSKFGSSFTVHFAGGGGRMVHVDYRNSRKPVAITNDAGSGEPDVIPDNAEDAAELIKDTIKFMAEEAKWFLANGNPEPTKQAMKVLEEFSASMKRRL